MRGASLKKPSTGFTLWIKASRQPPCQPRFCQPLGFGSLGTCSHHHGFRLCHRDGTLTIKPYMISPAENLTSWQFSSHPKAKTAGACQGKLAHPLWCVGRRHCESEERVMMIWEKHRDIGGSPEPKTGSNRSRTRGAWPGKPHRLGRRAITMRSRKSGSAPMARPAAAIFRPGKTLARPRSIPRNASATTCSLGT